PRLQGPLLRPHGRHPAGAGDGSRERRRPLAARVLAQLALHVARHLALLDRLALVEAVLALRERQLDLRARASEVDARRHEREAALSRSAEQPVDLAASEQQLAVALGRVVVVVGGRIRRDVEMVEPHFAVSDGRVCVLQLRPAGAQRLHLGTSEHDAALDRVEQVEAVTRGAVARDVAGADLALALALRHAESLAESATRARSDAIGARRAAD